jgi:hypothetical protein
VILDPVAGTLVEPKTNTARKNPFKRAFMYSAKPDVEMKLKAEVDSMKVIP